VSKTLVDVDDDLLAQARGLLGTATKKDTINGALREVVQRQLRLDALATAREQTFLAALTDESFRAAAWRDAR